PVGQPAGARSEQAGDRPPAGGVRELTGFAEQLVGRVGDLAGVVLDEHEDVVAHFSTPRSRMISTIRAATPSASPLSISAWLLDSGAYIRRTASPASSGPSGASASSSPLSCIAARIREIGTYRGAWRAACTPITAGPETFSSWMTPAPNSWLTLKAP